MGKLFESLGLKRLIAGALSSILDVLRVVPGTAEYISTIEMIAAFFGITGLAQAGVQGTLSKKKIATASAALSFLIVVCLHVPALGPLAPYLQKLAALLGAGALGAQFVREKEITQPKQGNFPDDSRDYTGGV